jgi:hypothetical protein
LNENIVFDGNILVGTKGAIFSCYHQEETESLQLINNMVWTLNDEEPHIGGIGTPKLVVGNIWANPRFQEGPTYPDTISLIENPYYDWSQHPTSFNAYSIPGKRHDMGKQFRIAFVGPRGKIGQKAPGLVVPIRGVEPVGLENR